MARGLATRMAAVGASVLGASEGISSVAVETRRKEIIGALHRRPG
jgi:hypothetical protein